MRVSFDGPVWSLAVRTRWRPIVIPRFASSFIEHFLTDWFRSTNFACLSYQVRFVQYFLCKWTKKLLLRQQDLDLC